MIIDGKREVVDSVKFSFDARFINYLSEMNSEEFDDAILRIAVWDPNYDCWFLGTSLVQTSVEY